jgi:cytochrome c heme-lyase
MANDATNKEAREAPSGCPVKGVSYNKATATSDDDAPRGFFSGLFKSNAKQTSSSQTCPVKGGGGATPASIEEAANHSQLPAPGQMIPLSRNRVISSIPRGSDASDQSSDDDTAGKASAVPAHQPTNSSQWMYPSEQQFYNAMRKKGYNPPIESIPSVLKIHNAVNERSWLQVRKWEKALHNNEDPKLAKFVGRPKDLSPKAFFNSRVLMTQEPFDRHDWYVEDQNGGEPRRYVIDFYEGKEKSGHLSQSNNEEGVKQDQTPQMMKPPSMYIDVRPALDTPGAAIDRIVMGMREALPGLTAAFDSYKRS